MDLYRLQKSNPDIQQEIFPRLYFQVCETFRKTAQSFQSVDTVVTVTLGPSAVKALVVQSLERKHLRQTATSKNMMTVRWRQKQSIPVNQTDHQS